MARAMKENEANTAQGNCSKTTTGSWLNGIVDRMNSRSWRTWANPMVERSIFLCENTFDFLNFFGNWWGKSLYQKELSISKSYIAALSSNGKVWKVATNSTHLSLSLSLKKGIFGCPSEKCFQTEVRRPPAAFLLQKMFFLYSECFFQEISDFFAGLLLFASNFLKNDLSRLK